MELVKLNPNDLVTIAENWMLVRTTLAASSVDSNEDSVPSPAFGVRVRQQEKIVYYAWSLYGTPLKAPLSAANSDTTPIIILKEVSSELEAYLTWFEFGARQQAGHMHESEWIALLKVLYERFQFDFLNQPLPKQIQKALEINGLAGHLGALINRSKLKFFSLAELRFFYQKKWDPNSFETVELLDSSTRQLYFACLEKLQCSMQAAKEILQHTCLIARKSELKLINRLLTNSEAKPADDFRRLLAATANPELTAMSHTRLERLRALKVPPRTSVFGDPSFENDVIKITFQPRNIADFDSFKDWVNSESTRERLKMLIEIYQ
jgi:hypothetical protein